MGVCTFIADTGLDNAYDDNKRKRTGTLSASTTYANPGGDTISPAIFNLGTVDDIDIDSVDTTGARFAAYDKPNSKLKILTALGTEAVNGTNQSAFLFRCRVSGT